ncbi:Hypothetical predicted protein [Pelobates cultripes]|nr:Hypothetical predicted protein [Pelobates cultripes]
MESSVKNFVVILAAIFIPCTAAYPNGLVTDSCNTMEPNHGTTAQTSAAPYTLQLSTTTYGPESIVQVTLVASSDTQFKGFMIQAHAGNNNTPLGTFRTKNQDAQLLKCTTDAAAVSHTSSSQKTKVEVEWVAPKANISNLHFRATVVQVRPTYWMNIASQDLIYNGGSHLVPALKLILIGTAIVIFTLLRV